MSRSDLLEVQSVSSMVSESEVIITDQFDETGAANQNTVRHKVIVPVARHLLKKKSVCHKLPRTLLTVAFLATTLLFMIFICIVYETWWTSKDPELGFKPHSKEDYKYHTDIVNYVNENKASWKAEYNKFASRGSDEDENELEQDKSKDKDNEVMKKFADSKYAVFGDTLTYLPKLAARNDIQLPTNFDARLKWPMCSSVHRIYNQGSCGSCWSVSATSTMSDRICISTNATQQPQISSTDLLTCCSHCGTCGGAVWPLYSFTYWKQNGIVTGGAYGSYEGCKPYDRPSACGSPCSSDLYVPQESEKVCERQCQPVYGKKSYQDDIHKAKTAYWIKPIPNAEEYFPDIVEKITKSIGNVSYTTLIKRELYLNGPAMACFPVFDELQHYKSGVYNRTSPNSRLLYGHCAKLLGWGVDEESGLEFWQYANTWGQDFGENGFFRVAITNLPEEVASGNI
ncbi:Pept-C1 domain-containing protein [Aphelenchoides bicaudatus]|nr:Pept-C1 domain-containing protein [Aphelenchoides bicaudatus]